jgi:hypothetical protein
MQRQSSPELVVNHRSRFWLWCGVGIAALIGAALKAAGIFDLAGMPREWGIVWGVASIGVCLILYAVLFVPQKYAFAEAIEIHYLLRTKWIAFADVVSIKSEYNDTSRGKAKGQIIAALAGVPLIESFARIELRSGRVIRICLASEQLDFLLSKWDQVNRDAIQRRQHRSRSP